MTFTNFIIEFSLGAVFGAAGMWIYVKSGIAAERLEWARFGMSAVRTLERAELRIHHYKERAFHLAKTVNKWRPARGSKGRFVKKVTTGNPAA